MPSSQSADVSNELQNVMLQHASIDTFVRHGLGFWSLVRVYQSTGTISDILFLGDLWA